MESNRNLITFTLLRAQGYSLLTVVTFLLKTEKNSQSKIAKNLGVTRPFISQIITGTRKSKSVKHAITAALGFDPWDVAAEG